MSWSMIDYGDYWAHAHDSEQILFMALAARCLEETQDFQDAEWLQEWKSYWKEHKNSHGNGCSDIDLQGFLIGEERVGRFRSFLSHYRCWVQEFGPAISAVQVNEITAMPFYQDLGLSCAVEGLVGFSQTIDDVLVGNSQNKRVHRRSE